MSSRPRKMSLTRARRPTSAAQVALLLVAVLVLMFSVGPTIVPGPMLLLVGLTIAALAAVAAMLAVREYGGRYNTWQTSRFGRWQASNVVGTIVFVAILGWWLSPWSPMLTF